MIIINADDWGRSDGETDAAVRCHVAGRITSATAMVFMSDSQRAAGIALDHGLEVGLHLNFAEGYTATSLHSQVAERQQRIVRFLRKHRYAYLFYNPKLRNDFEYVYRSQVDEFIRLYRKSPSHIDGHHHYHLCANVLTDRVIEEGHWIRPSFYFWPGERSGVNRSLRQLLNRWLARRYRVVDHFFALSQSIGHERWTRIVELAGSRLVEVSAHPVEAREYEFLMGRAFASTIGTVQTGSYNSL